MGRETGHFVPVYQQLANVLRAGIVATEDRLQKLLPTERELAQSHGVSRATVRRALDVLADEGLVKRTQGLGTVTVPAGVAAWARRRQSRLLTVVTWRGIASESPRDFYWQIFQGIATAAEQAGYVVSTRETPRTRGIHGTDARPEDPDKVAAVLMVGMIDDCLIDIHVDAGYPVVCVDYWPRNPQADAVVVDCFSEGQMATEYLLGQGHRDLFFLGNSYAPMGSAPPRHEPDSELLLAGCRAAMDLAGLTLSDDRIHFCWDDPADIAQAADRIISAQPRPTAGLVFNHKTLTQLRDALAEREVACPDDISLIAKSHQHLDLQATSVMCDAYALGQVAVDMAIQRATGKRSIAFRASVPSYLQRGPTVTPVAR